MATIQKIVLINGYPLRDTNTHSYRTDPSYFYLLSIGMNIPINHAYAIWIYNSTNQSVTIQIIGNIDTTKTYPDITIGNPQSISASSAASIGGITPENGLLPYIGLQLSSSTAPTSGNVLAYLVPYRG